MHNVQITTTATKLVRKMFAALAIGAVAMAFIAAGPAHADTKKGSGGSTGCLIENNGHLERVPVGTKISLLTCGADGEWHFGWLITEISSPPKNVKPINTSALRHGVLRLTKAQR